MDEGCSEGVLDYLCGQREDRRGRRKGNGMLEVTKWSGTCQGILFVRNGLGGWRVSRREEVLWKDRAEDIQRRIESKKLRARP